MSSSLIVLVFLCLGVGLHVVTVLLHLGLLVLLVLRHQVLQVAGGLTEERLHSPRGKSGLPSTQPHFTTKKDLPSPFPNEYTERSLP